MLPSMGLSPCFQVKKSFHTGFFEHCHTQKKVLMTPEKNLSVVTVTMFSLVCFNGIFEEGIPYLEDAALKLRQDLGEKHLEVGRAYTYLAAAYIWIDINHKEIESLAHLHMI